MGRLHCELNRQGIIPLYSDILLEPMISHTYGRKFTPQMMMVWNETQKVYPFDYSVSRAESINWVLNGTFKNASYSFDAPKIMSWQRYRLSILHEALVASYFKLIGNWVIKYMNMYAHPIIYTSPPISYIMDSTGEDIFQRKFIAHFYTFIALCCLVSFINL